MPTYLGVDIGTSAIKAVIVNETQAVLAEAHMPLDISRRQESWSEQDPEAWWVAVQGVAAELRSQVPEVWSQIEGIGLSGQMHGAVLLDSQDRPLRPAILWNDGRSFREAEQLGAKYPHLSEALGVIPMPGFTAPKLLWLARHERQIFEAVRTVLLPKDYIRLKLSGDRITDMSDAAGTWWLDEAARDWSDEALSVTGLDRRQMPLLVEGSQPSGTLRSDFAKAWGLRSNVVVAGGAGDAAAGAVGLGAIQEGSAFISLGTSGQFFTTTETFRPAPEALIHAFCHAVPQRWFQMAAMLNGASCLAWLSGLLKTEIDVLLREAEAHYQGPAQTLFLPYLTGERTPHNDPHARGVFFNLSPETTPSDLTLAVLEGVAFSFADAKDCLVQAGAHLTEVGIIGGGSRSIFWTKILSNILDLPLLRFRGGDKGPAFGAARLAILATAQASPDIICGAPPVLDRIEPDPNLVERYRPRIEAFRRLYGSLKPEFSMAAGGDN
ncbi:xylulokinase [Microvirga puerhi]|uniref:Xylulose kinase n=1 Tax=Microvirga puerhi TaxID=2876078 RepID=A0ABS7VJ71_9HYPH|nr:xylulokinase [Microvirga puerhi]MBZ6075150.1 xylulokinase [Microvirga puerhi]